MASPTNKKTNIAAHDPYENVTCTTAIDPAGSQKIFLKTPMLSITMDIMFDVLYNP
jgi:hypothetical protein